MTIKSFFKLVEIQTKVASVIPFLLGTLYSIYHYNRFIIKNFFLMFISLLAFDMATTTINNYIDYKKAKKTKGYGYEEHNAIVRDQIKEGHVLLIIAILLGGAVIFGLLLFLNTNYVLLFLGVLSFLVGIHYTYGPLPISRMPIGEIYSGFFMGFIIVFISIYIHVYDENIVSLFYQHGILGLTLDVLDLISIFLISVPAILGIANIMLANNICDIGEDLENERYTLPIYIGKSKSLKLFKVLYYLIYLNIGIIILLGIEPIISIVLFATAYPVMKNTNEFLLNPSKKETFKNAIMNFILINGTRLVCLFIAILLKALK